MPPFAELVKQLREKSNAPHIPGDLAEKMFIEAADAIETLTAGIPVVELRGRDVSTIVMRINTRLSVEQMDKFKNNMQDAINGRSAKLLILDRDMEILGVFHDAPSEK